MDGVDKDKIWELVVGKVHNNLSEEEEHLFREIEGLEYTQTALNQAKSLYNKSRGSILIKEIDKGKNWEYINNEISRGRVKQLATGLSKYAAIFIIALLTGVMLTNIYRKSAQSLASNRVDIEWGQMSKMALSDGTEIWLNAGTTLEYPASFGTGTRTVKLSGEAQFKVAHNSKIPFEVVTKTGVIKVYGTTFNVASYDDDPDMTVTLIEGKVAFKDSNGDRQATLEPSEQLTINKETGQAKIKKVDPKFYSSWVDGKILLDDTRLVDLAVILKRWYNVDIKFVDEKTGELRVSGTIVRGKSLDSFLKIMERMYGIRCETKTNSNIKDEITIYKK